MGIVAGGGAAGYFVLLPLMAAALQAAGWRTAFLWLGVGIVLVTVPIVLWLLRDDPRSDEHGRKADDAIGRPLPVIQLGRHGNFWSLAGSFFICGVTSIGVTDTHLIPHAQDHHISAVTAASALAFWRWSTRSSPRSPERWRTVSGTRGCSAGSMPAGP